ncbi:helix-turn-helix domain-containing protein [Halopseudomonas xiamenensis]|uniref:helix-turn-helix domain-containing protein n=1 Tax=Halopseudomonas xiamenensis TaxID=157792 RepID=UPI0016284AFB|nr:helix-turn-helix domain-containing protein [Halopseudomonas xiamenensis]
MKKLENRADVFADIYRQLDERSISLGETIHQLRTRITGLTQADFARMCKISLRTLRQLEQDNGNPTLETVNSVLRAFGMQLGVVPLRRR